jgi:hypothetical protein
MAERRVPIYRRTWRGGSSGGSATGHGEDIGKTGSQVFPWIKVCLWPGSATRVTTIRQEWPVGGGWKGRGEQGQTPASAEEVNVVAGKDRAGTRAETRMDRRSVSGGTEKSR